MAIYKVSDDVLIKVKELILDFTSGVGINDKSLEMYAKRTEKRRKKAEKLIKLLEDEYYI